MGQKLDHVIILSQPLLPLMLGGGPCAGRRAAFTENRGFVTEESGRTDVGAGTDLPAHSTLLNFLCAYYKYDFKTGFNL